MNESYARVTCDMCGRTIECKYETNPWLRALTLNATGDLSGESEYVTMGMDLCPECLDRAVRIRCVKHEKKRYNDILGDVYDVSSRSFEWVDDDEV